MIKPVNIYIPLVGEGVNVSRPTLGQLIEKNVYRVLPTQDYDPDDEHWKFPPGSFVQCTREIRDGQEVLMAVAEKGHEFVK